MAKAEADALIQEMFEADADNNGQLSKQEIKTYMQSKSHGDISDGDVQHFIEAIDQNDDNLISKVEVTKRIYELYGVE